MSESKCKYVFKKGTNKGKVCNIVNCTLHLKNKFKSVEKQIKPERNEDKNTEFCPSSPDSTIPWEDFSSQSFGVKN